MHIVHFMNMVFNKPLQLYTKASHTPLHRSPTTYTDGHIDTQIFTQFFAFQYKIILFNSTIAAKFYEQKLNEMLLQTNIKMRERIGIESKIFIFA